MNKNPFFTASIEAIENETTRFYEKAAFGAIHFDGAGQTAAISAAIAVLEDAQARSADENMQCEAVGRACSYLAGQNAKAAPLTQRFWDSLIIPEQPVRFEATAKTLRVIRQQFGA